MDIVNSVSVEKPQQKPADLSRTIVVLLIVVSVALSVLSTWLVLDEISKVKMTPVEYKPSLSAANIRFGVIEPAIKTTHQQGMVAFNVLN